MKYHAVMFFYHWSEIMDEKQEDEYVLTSIAITKNYNIAFDLYSNTPCPASQLITANTKEELNKKIDEMKANYKNEDWLEKNLYPYL